MPQLIALPLLMISKTLQGRLLPHAITRQPHLVEPLKGLVVGAVGQLQDLDHFLYLLMAQLLVDGSQVGCALCPEVQLSQRTRVCAMTLKCKASSGNSLTAGMLV